MKLTVNPVGTMDSVDALELLNKAFHIVRKQPTTSPWLVAALRHQILRHGRALRPVIGEEDVLSERYGQSGYVGHRPIKRSNNRSATAPRRRVGTGKRKSQVRITRRKVKR